MYMRKNRTLSEISLEDMKSEPESFPTEIPDKGKSPAELYEQNEEKRILSRAINTLTLELRTALLLRLEERSSRRSSRNSGSANRNPKGRVVSSAGEIARAAHTRPRISAETEHRNVGFDSSPDLACLLAKETTIKVSCYASQNPTSHRLRGSTVVWTHMPETGALRFLLVFFFRNSLTACRTRAEIGARDFLDSAASVFTCDVVSHTTVLFMRR